MLKYEQLAEKLRQKIVDGQFAPGVKIPSENELTVSEGLSRQTVRQALSVLEREGQIIKRRGSGSVVTGRARKRDATGRIAVITTYISEYIFPDILRGIERTLARHGCAPTLAASHNRVDNERAILETLLANPVDGIIVEGTKTALPNPNIDLYRQLAAAGVPMVFINGYYPDFKPSVYVVADDRAGGIMATELLLRKGHTRIAGIFKSDDIQGHRRYAGYTEALRKASLSVVDDHVLWFTTETRDTLINANLAAVLDGCTAVVCYNDEVAVQVLGLLRSRGVEVPGQMAVISFDDSVFSAMASPRITSLSLSKEEIGQIAAAKILGLIRGVTESPQVLPWLLTEKEST